MVQMVQTTKTCAGLLLLASLLLTGCIMQLGPSRPTIPPFTPAAPPPGKALVYVYREGGIVGASGYSRIYVNGEFLAGLHRGQYAPREVPPGTVVFATTPRVSFGAPLILFLNNLQNKEYEKLRIEVEPGQTCYVKWSVGDEMKLVDATTGVKELGGLQPAKVGED